MTGAERQRRYLLNLAKKLSPPPPAPVAAVRAPGLVIHVDHLRMDPVRTARWLRQKLGDRATLALLDALKQAMSEGVADADVDAEVD
jgi:hypothetical protein